MDTLPGNRIFKRIREERQTGQKNGSHVLQRTVITGGDEKKWTGYLCRYGYSLIQGDLASHPLVAGELKEGYNNLVRPPDGFSSTLPFTRCRRRMDRRS
ncbi:MAG: hypothetical protein IPP85_02100 [Propionivibrio sp.]|nr:hypothetical protein [Propionivibrio sp.]